MYLVRLYIYIIYTLKCTLTPPVRQHNLNTYLYCTPEPEPGPEMEKGPETEQGPKPDTCTRKRSIVQ